MRPANGFVRRATLAACAILLVAVVGAAGCASPVPAPAPIPIARLARVDLVNLSECDWRVTVARPTGGEERTVLLPARATTHLELAGGDYAITQTALAGLAGPESTRQFNTHLDPGEAYRWRLVTLFTASTGAPP